MILLLEVYILLFAYHVLSPLYKSINDIPNKFSYVHVIFVQHYSKSANLFSSNLKMVDLAKGKSNFDEARWIVQNQLMCVIHSSISILNYSMLNNSEDSTNEYYSMMTRGIAAWSNVTKRGILCIVQVCMSQTLCHQILCMMHWMSYKHQIVHRWS